MTAPIRAEDVEPEQVSWIYKERIPRSMISVIAGRPEQGKGLFVAHLAAHVSNTPMGNRMGKVLYSAIEDSHGLMTRPRLEAAGADLDNVLLWRFQLPIQFSELEAYILDKEIDLLVMDPFAAHLSGHVSRQSDNIRQVLSPLSELIETTGTAVVITEHVLKRVSANAHPLAAIGGSGSGLVAASRMAFLFGKDPADEDRRILACVKNNIRERPLAIEYEIDTMDIDRVGDIPLLVFQQEFEFDAARLLETDPKRARGVGRPADKRAAAAEWLTNYLYEAGTPVPAGKVFEDAKHYGITTKTLRRAVTEMGVLRDPPGGGRHCRWSLPQSVLDILNGTDGEDKPDETIPNTDALLLSDDDFNALLGGDDDGSTI